MKKILVGMLLMLVVSCVNSSPKSDSKLSFYYWKTSFALDQIERETLQNLAVTKLYIRYFDVGLKNGTAVPITPIVFKESVPQLEVVPVIYLKNEVVLYDKLDVKKLASQLVDFVQQINEHNNIDSQEIQLDCDWSLTSKDRFFALIEQLRKETEMKISATIRLHQVKYAAKTGVPPVDRGVLMYYNMGRIASDSLNSIYDRNIAQKYNSGLKDYPLSLAYALPIYSWVVHSRNDQVVRLVSRLRVADLKEQSALEQLTDHEFVVKQEASMFGFVFQKGDRLKVENTTASQLKEMTTDLYRASGKCPTEIILYDLNSKNIKYYDQEIFKEMVRCR
ncbi:MULTISPECIES: hypothetical protein [unclassified Myroides]|uniref:hypothetical protein n=1 Tax=unclassified Myroides TaxID=2642485 RepID=UPI0015FA973D|nr:MULTISPECIES: hypothetical protein [unclassified Myroides]MBB1149392.1 hypothetical protein [Myroides sp. NP-2]MDM1406705.1 hypothetical protein [Myroides sp. DF42-4-2]